MKQIAKYCVPLFMLVFGWGLVNLIRSDETTDEPPATWIDPKNKTKTKK